MRDGNILPTDAPIFSLRLQFWSLGIGASLKLGCWCLELLLALSLDTQHSTPLICAAMNRSDLMRRQAFFWGLTLGIWALVVLAFTGQLMLARSWTWTQAAKAALSDWLPWAILAPAIAWLSVQFPLEFRKLPISLPVHLGACAA